MSLNAVPSPSETPQIVEKPKIVGSFRVDFYEDNKLFGSSFYSDGRCIKTIDYNTETKKKESETIYFYKKNGELDYAKKDGAIVSKDDYLEIDRSAGDSVFYYDVIKSKGVEFPFADIVPQEIKDISDILSIADNYSDFKTEDQREGNRRVLKFIGFNKTHRFHHSPMAMLIGEGDFIRVQDYELTLENNYPTKESLKTDDGELTKTYSYKDGQLAGVVYKFTDLQNRTNSLEKRFEYHGLNQKP